MLCSSPPPLTPSVTRCAAVARCCLPSAYAQHPNGRFLSLSIPFRQTRSIKGTPLHIYTTIHHRHHQNNFTPYTTTIFAVHHVRFKKNRIILKFFWNFLKFPPLYSWHLFSNFRNYIWWPEDLQISGRSPQHQKTTTIVHHHQVLSGGWITFESPSLPRYHDWRPRCTTTRILSVRRQEDGLPHAVTDIYWATPPFYNPCILWSIEGSCIRVLLYYCIVLCHTDNRFFVWNSWDNVKFQGPALKEYWKSQEKYVTLQMWPPRNSLIFIIRGHKL